MIKYNDMQRTWHTPLFLIGLFLCMPFFVHASQLLSATDLISSSVPGVPASHEIVFTATHEIPANGEVSVRFNGSGSSFQFPTGFDFTNVDFAVATSSDFVPYILDLAADVSTSSARLVANGDGDVRVHLASDPSFAVPPGARVRVRIGAGVNAGAMINTITEGSQRYTISTFDSGGALIDMAVGLVNIMKPTGVGAWVAGVAPVISQGLPSGLLPGGTTKVMLSAITNVPAFCRYSLLPDIGYDSMPLNQVFKGANFYRFQSVIVPTADNQSYTYYVRCYSKYGLTANEVDYPIHFEVGMTPNGPPTPPPPPPGTQEGDHSGGGNSLPQSGLTILGRTFPNAQVSILKDGKDYRTLGADSLGNFSTQDSSFDRGTYGFTIAGVDGSGMRTATYSTTLFLSASTQNNIGPVLLSPTLTAPTGRIEPGGGIIVNGLAIPSSVVQVVVLTDQDPLQQPLLIATTTSSAAGNWTLKLPTETLTKGTYSLRAQSLLAQQGNSLFSNPFLLGVGEKPQGDMRKRSDINGDGKVNLADLSILLFNWKKASPSADINSDGIVNITDFSIMLSAWTG